MQMNMLNALLGPQPKAASHPVANQGREDQGTADDSGFTNALFAEQSGAGERDGGGASASMSDEPAGGAIIVPSGTSNDSPEIDLTGTAVLIEDASETLADFIDDDRNGALEVNVDGPEQFGVASANPGVTVSPDAVAVADPAGATRVTAALTNAIAIARTDDTRSLDEFDADAPAEDQSGQPAGKSRATVVADAGKSLAFEPSVAGQRQTGDAGIPAPLSSGDRDELQSPADAARRSTQTAPTPPPDQVRPDAQILEKTRAEPTEPDAPHDDGAVLLPEPKQSRPSLTAENRSGEVALARGASGPFGNDPEAPVVTETATRPAMSTPAASQQSQLSGASTTSNATLLVTASQQSAPASITASANATAVDATAFREAVVMRPDASMIQQIVSAASSRSSAGTVEVFLDPPELGKIEISIDLGDQGLRASLSAERQSTQDMIRRNLSELAQTLEDAGFSDIDLDFSDSRDGADARDGDALPGTFGDTELQEVQPIGVTLNLIAGSTMDLRL